jgi:hypothetical protein
MAHWTWTGSAIACAVLLPAIPARAGLMLPVVLRDVRNFCNRARAAGAARGLREFHETVAAERSGSRGSRSLPRRGPQATLMTFVLANLLAVTSIVLAWVFRGLIRGELMGGHDDGGIAFAAHSVLECETRAAGH